VRRVVVDVACESWPGEFNDLPVVRQASRWHYDMRLRHGIRIFEYQPTMMHAKTMVVDGLWVTIGSSNFDDRSFRLNDRGERQRLRRQNRRADTGDVLRRPEAMRGGHPTQMVPPFVARQGEGSGSPMLSSRSFEPRGRYRR